jgi:hypothetical protein
MASAVGCKQSPGAARLACLKQVPASTIRAFTNGASSGTWGGLVDKYVFYLRAKDPRQLNTRGSVTLFSDPLQRIRNGQTSKVPFVIGHTENDGSLSLLFSTLTCSLICSAHRSLFALNQDNLTTYLSNTFGTLVTADQVRALYASGLSDNAVIAEVVKDFLFLWLVSKFIIVALFIIETDRPVTNWQQPCRALECRCREYRNERIPVCVRYDTISSPSTLHLFCSGLTARSHRSGLLESPALHQRGCMAFLRMSVPNIRIQLILNKC